MTVTADSIARERYPKMRLPKELKKFFGPITDNVHIRIVLSGPTQTGKSTFLYKVTDQLARKDIRVLYGNFEERPNVGTIKTKLDSLRIRNKNIHFLDNRSVEEFYKELDTGNYKFAVIDSLSVLFNSRKDIKDFFESLDKKYPTIPFFMVVHYNKDGKGYQGSTLIQHDADIFLETAPGGKVLTKKNRFFKDGQKPTMKIWK